MIVHLNKYAIVCVTSKANEDLFMKLLKAMIERGANPNIQDGIGLTAMHAAINNNQIGIDFKEKIIKLLKDAGSNLSLRSRDYGTPRDLVFLTGLEQVQPLIIKLIAN